MGSRDTLTELQWLTRACREAADDVAKMRGGKEVTYNLDFSLLCPVLFPNPGAGSSDFFEPSAPAVRRMLAAANTRPFRLVMTRYTLLEIFDQMHHQGLRLATSRAELYSSVDEGLLRDQLLTTPDLRRELSQITEQGINDHVREPIEFISGLLDSRTLVGIGDVVDISEVRKVADKNQLRRFYEEQRTSRLASDKRAIEDSEFHYRIDAANNCLTLAVAQTASEPVYFVTNTGVNLRQLVVGDSSFARLERTPLFVLNALEGRENGLIGNDEAKFLRRLSRRSLELADELGDQRFREAPFNMRLEISSHLVEVSEILGHTEPADPAALEQSVEDIIAAVRRPKDVQERLRVATEEMRAGAQRLEAEMSALDLGYVADFDFDFRNDPVVARVRAELGLTREP